MRSAARAMPPFAASRVLRASALATRVATFLDAAPFEIGRVHSAFDRAVNVLRRDGRLLVLHGPGPLAAPFAIAVTERVTWTEIERGVPVFLDARGHIAIDRIRIATAHARIADTAIAPGHWREAAAAITSPVDGRMPDDPLTARAVAAHHGSTPRDRARECTVHERSSEGGLALRAEPAALRVAPALASSTARVAMRRVAAGIRRGDAREILEGARPLIGLGEGLTPAGDDLLVGVLAALHRARPTLLSGAPDVVSALADVARDGTTVIAREFLLHALDGHFSEPIVALLSADDGDRARDALCRILSMGATSGADTVTGLRLAVGALAA